MDELTKCAECGILFDGDGEKDSLCMPCYDHEAIEARIYDIGEDW